MHHKATGHDELDDQDQLLLPISKPYDKVHDFKNRYVVRYLVSFTQIKLNARITYELFPK